LRIGIIARPDIPGTVDLAKKIIKLLGKKEILLHQKLAKKLGRRGSRPRAFIKADAIIAIGGDGTVLRAQRMAPDVPILGINLGARGFLAEVETPEVCEAIRMLIRGELRVIKRERLRSTIGRKRLVDALNDVVVVPEKLGKTISLTVKIEGETALEVVGDGVIVSTPTGSTAYARAAGGPILDPSLSSFVLVPICPTRHLMSPLVLPFDRSLEVGLTMPKRRAMVVVDGERRAKLERGEKIVISRSEKPATFFAWKGFYTKLKEKL
jgi:NAD+ kinase